MEDVAIKHNLVEPAYQFSGPGLQTGNSTEALRIAFFNGQSSTTNGTDVWFQHNTVYSTKSMSTILIFTGNSNGDWLNFKAENNLFALDNGNGAIFGDGGTTGNTALDTWCGSDGGPVPCARR